jgi:hypothetical protein
MVMGFALAYVALLLAIALELASAPPHFLLDRLILAPAAHLNALKKAEIRCFALWSLAAIVLLAFRESDGVRMMSLAVPDIVAWTATIELTTCLEGAGLIAGALLAFRHRDVLRDRMGSGSDQISRRPRSMNIQAIFDQNRCRESLDSGAA